MIYFQIWLELILDPKGHFTSWLYDNKYSFNLIDATVEL